MDHMVVSFLIFQPPLAGRRNNVDVSQGSGDGSMDQQDSTDASISTDTVRSNPNLQVNGATPSSEAQRRAASNEEKGEANRPVITGALLKDDMLQEDTFQEQQRKLGNGTLTPEHRDEDRMARNQKVETGMFVPSHKRSGSIPPRLIEESLELELEPKKSLDIYSQIKTSTKSILPGLSPKFELLQNEVSPIEEKES